MGPADQDNLERLGKVAAGGLAVLQAAFTALGAANGALGAVALNKPCLFVVCLIVITGGFLLMLSGLLSRGLATFRLMVGMTILVLGVGATAYAAIAVPEKSSSPTVDVEVVSTRPLVLRGTVSATGIKRGETFQVLAEGYEEPGRYVAVPPLLYHAVLGANSSGEVSSTFEFAVPPGKYEAVGIDAWSGELKPPGACGFSIERPGHLGFPKSEVKHLGCAVVRVAGVSGR